MRVLTAILMAMTACTVGLACMRPSAEAHSAAWLVGDAMLTPGESALV